MQFDTGNTVIFPGSIIAKIEDVTFTNNLLVVTPIGDGSATDSFPANSCHIATNGNITIEFRVAILKRFTLSFILKSID
ncbi:hypothetical protein [Cetobacterium sp.]|uniref:hypothetical protein n=1 Tax=Cetobacterium sp. TaxID=2071632 RepID=UPI003F679B64